MVSRRLASACTLAIVMALASELLPAGHRTVSRAAAGDAVAESPRSSDADEPRLREVGGAVPQAPQRDPHARLTVRFAGGWLETHGQEGAPVVTAAAAIVVDTSTRQVLYALNPHDRRAQASTTKITTAMVALQLTRPETAIVVSARAAAVFPDETQMGLNAGETLSLNELLWGAMLASANDAAGAIADGLGGREAFVETMNAQASAWELADTHYVNPAGLDADGHYSSAYDLAILGTHAIEDFPALREIMTAATVRLPATDGHPAFEVENLNKLVTEYPGAIGVKPGWTENAGGCLVGAVTRDGHTLVGAILGTPFVYTELGALFDYSFGRLGS
jgi:D-alanyl-D-alanine carboxypeptidase (penicillin-binding protein 5/6)